MSLPRNDCDAMVDPRALQVAPAIVATLESSELMAGKVNPAPLVRRLSPGGERIRIFSSALDRRRFWGFVRVGADLPAHRSSEQLPASAYRSSCRAAVRGAATHRHDHAASQHGSAVGGASTSRNRRFECAFLQQRVCERSVPQLQRFIDLRQRKQLLMELVAEAALEQAVLRRLPPAMKRHRCSSMPGHRDDLGHGQ
jgi:hypothetical protein